jgi:hypothetical protein
MRNGSVSGSFSGSLCIIHNSPCIAFTDPEISSKRRNEFGVGPESPDRRSLVILSQRNKSMKSTGRDLCYNYVTFLQRIYLLYVY